jgi:hypothetical protein
MQKLPLDTDTLAVTTFDPAPAQAIAAPSGDTNDEICYCLSLLAEDCFGPTAGCSTDHSEA